MRLPVRRFLPGLVLAAGLLTGCAVLDEPAEGPPARETVVAVTHDHQLVRFNAGQPRRVLDRRPLSGLAAGDEIVGIDFRVARGVLYALTRAGRLYTLDVASGRLSPVGNGSPSALPLQGSRFGFDFNPVADRIRVVSDSGQNLRLHPDTGAAVDGDPARDGVQGDPALAWVSGDTQAAHPPRLLAAGYTYNAKDDKLTTNFALDGRAGTLVVQGSREGVQPVVSPNSGRLATVGPLGTGALADAAFDISDVRNTALAAVRTEAAPSRTRLLRIDLATGQAVVVGTVGDGAPVRGIAIEP